MKHVMVLWLTIFDALCWVFTLLQFNWITKKVISGFKTLTVHKPYWNCFIYLAGTQSLHTWIHQFLILIVFPYFISYDTRTFINNKNNIKNIIEKWGNYTSKILVLEFSDIFLHWFRVLMQLKTSQYKILNKTEERARDRGSYVPRRLYFCR